MKRIKGSIDSIPVVIDLPQTLLEFKEGARLFQGKLDYNQGLLFNFRSPQYLVTENSGVEHDLTLLYFNALGKQSVVTEMSTMALNSNKTTSSKGCYSYLLELRSDFCKAYHIRVGSILSIPIVKL